MEKSGMESRTHSLPARTFSLYDRSLTHQRSFSAPRLANRQPLHDLFQPVEYFQPKVVAARARSAAASLREAGSRCSRIIVSTSCAASPGAYKRPLTIAHDLRYAAGVIRDH